MEHLEKDFFLEGYNDSLFISELAPELHSSVSEHYLREMVKNGKASEYATGFIMSSLDISLELGQLSDQNYERTMQQIIEPQLTQNTKLTEEMMPIILDRLKRVQLEISQQSVRNIEKTQTKSNDVTQSRNAVQTRAQNKSSNKGLSR